MDEDEKNEKVKFLRLFFVLIVISLIFFLILLVMGKLQIELVETWISIVAIILGIFIMPREKKARIKEFCIYIFGYGSIYYNYTGNFAYLEIYFECF